MMKMPDMGYNWTGAIIVALHLTRISGYKFRVSKHKDKWIVRNTGITVKNKVGYMRINHERTIEP